MWYGNILRPASPIIFKCLEPTLLSHFETVWFNEDFFRQIETISIRTLAFVQHHSVVVRPNQQIISVPRPTIFEIDALLGTEQQKEHASSNIRGNLIRLNEQEASAQQKFEVGANMAPGASQKRQRQHRVSPYFTPRTKSLNSLWYSINANPAEQPSLSYLQPCGHTGMASWPGWSSNSL